MQTPASLSGFVNAATDLALWLRVFPNEQMLLGLWRLAVSSNMSMSSVVDFLRYSNMQFDVTPPEGAEIIEWPKWEGS